MTTSSIANLDKIDLLLALETCQQLIGCSKEHFGHLLRIFSSTQLPPCSVLATQLLLPSATKPAIPTELLNISFSEDWLQEYVESNYFSIDPIKRKFIQNFEVNHYTWRDVFDAPRNGLAPHYRQRLKEHNLNNGISFCVRAAGVAKMTLFSFGGDEIAEDRRSRILLEYLAPHMEQAFNRIGCPSDAFNNSAQRIIELTPRETDVLSWAMYGKTNGMIAGLLNISERTVKFHVQNIMEKLNASNRAQAVAVALQMGFIAP